MSAKPSSSSRPAPAAPAASSLATKQVAQAQSGSTTRRGPLWWRRWVRRPLGAVFGRLSWPARILWAWLFVLVVGVSLAMVLPIVPSAVAWLAGLWLAVAIVLVGVVARLAKSTVLVLVLGMAMNAAYLSYTAYGERNFDVSHQVKYVKYMIKHKTAPPDAYCFICHHPPLFYGAAAVTHEIGRAMRFPEPLRVSQSVPFLSVMLMGLCTALLTRRFSPSIATTNLATALMLCWPYSLVMSGRIHNDSLASGLMMAGIYACVRWFQDKDRPSLVLAAVLCALSVFCKSNGYVLVILLFCASALVWLQSKDKMAMTRRAGPILVALVVALGGYAANRGSARQYENHEEDKKKKNKAKDKDKAAQEKKEEEDGAALKPLTPEERAKLEADNEKLSLSERLLGSAGKIGARSWMGNEPFNYLYFDLEGFFKHPFVLARHDGSGRQFFWNHVLKSSLFSTHNHRPDYETSYRSNGVLAGVLHGVFFGMLVFLLLSLTQLRRAHVWKYGVLVLAGLGFLGGGAAFRILIPHSHHSDFRHMFPVLLPAIVAYALFVDNWRRKDSVMHWVGQGLALAMIVGSCVYYLPKHDWVKRHGPRHYVIKSAAQVGRYAKAESDWNEYQYVVLEPNERLWVDIPDEPTGYGISVATDHNDIYEIRIIGEQETRIIDIGMKEATGIAIFNEHLVPPVSKVKAIEVRPRGGDVHYSVGHLILNPAGYNRPYTLPPDPPPKPAQADPLKPGQPAPLPKPGEATARDPGGSRQEVGAFGAASGKALQVSPGAASGKALQVSPGAASGKARQASPGAASGKARQARPDAASGKSPSARPGAASGKSQPKSPGAAKPPRRKP